MGALSMARKRSASMPLARLMAIASKSFIDDLHVRLVERGVHDVRPAFGYVLLAAREQPTSVTAVAALMGTTKQAASKLVEVMAAAGFVTREAHAVDARRQAIALTARGREVLVEVEAIYAELEARWAKVLGRDRVEAIRRDLIAVLEATHGGRLPPVRPL